MNIPRGKFRKIAICLLLAGIAGTVGFAGALAVKLAGRERDEAYYSALSAAFNVDAASNDPVSGDVME